MDTLLTEHDILVNISRQLTANTINKKLQYKE